MCSGRCWWTSNTRKSGTGGQELTYLRGDSLRRLQLQVLDDTGQCDGAARREQRLHRSHPLRGELPAFLRPQDQHWAANLVGVRPQVIQRVEQAVGYPLWVVLP